MTKPGDGRSTNDEEHAVETPIVETDQIRLTRWCMELVSRYRTGVIPKIRAINEIFSIVFESELEEEEQDQVTGHFLGLLDEAKRSFASSGRPTSTPTVDGSNGRQGLTNPGGANESTEPHQSVLDRARTTFLGSGVGENGGGNDTSGLVDVVEQAPAEEFGDELDYRWKPRINIAKLPWRSRIIEKTPAVDPVLRETQ